MSNNSSFGRLGRGSLGTIVSFYTTLVVAIPNTFIETREGLSPTNYRVVDYEVSIGDVSSNDTSRELVIKG